MQENSAPPDTPYTNTSASPDTPYTNTSASPDTPYTNTSASPDTSDSRPAPAPPAPRSATAAEPVRSELSADLYALASHVMRNSHKGAFETIAELDLSFSHIKTLYTIYSSEQELSLKALAESLEMTFATMSRTVDSLVERGFIDRVEDPEDRRMKRITLTPAGAAVPAALNRSRLLGIQELVESITDQEAESLGGALRSLVAAHPEIAAHRPVDTDTPPILDGPADAPTAANAITADAHIATKEQR